MGRDKSTAVQQKKNVVSSDSSRAAELLGGNVANINVFTGFSAFSQQSGASSISASNLVDSQYDQLKPELSVLLKKLSKRDSITKQKAVDELNVMVDSLTDEEVLSLMPVWPNVYYKLSIDSDRKIRLSINQIHASLVLRLKSKVGPQLRDLMGPSLNSTFDLNREVAAVASKALHELFPTHEKLQNALLFTMEQISQYTVDHLLVKTEQTISDPRYMSVEEIASRYSHVVSGCLKSISYLLEYSESVRSKCLQSPLLLNQLVVNDKLWNKLVHSDPYIRSAAYQLLCTMATVKADLVLQQSEYVQKYFIKNLFADKDVLTHKEMWDAVLMVNKHCASLYGDGKMDKQIAKQFLTFVRQCCYGSVQLSFPCLVVYIATVPLTSLKRLISADFANQIWASLSSEHLNLRNFKYFVDAYADYIVFMNSDQPEAVPQLLQNAQSLSLCPHQWKHLADKLDAKYLSTKMWSILFRFNRVQDIVCDNVQTLICENRDFASGNLLSPDEFAAVVDRVIVFVECCEDASVQRSIYTDAVSNVIVGAKEANNFSKSYLKLLLKMVNSDVTLANDRSIFADIIKANIKDPNNTDLLAKLTSLIMQKFDAKSILDEVLSVVDIESHLLFLVQVMEETKDLQMVHSEHVVKYGLELAKAMEWNDIQQRFLLSLLLRGNSIMNVEEYQKLTDRVAESLLKHADSIMQQQQILDAVPLTLVDQCWTQNGLPQNLKCSLLVVHQALLTHDDKFIGKISWSMSSDFISKLFDVLHARLADGFGYWPVQSLCDIMIDGLKVVNQDFILKLVQDEKILFKLQSIADNISVRLPEQQQVSLLYDSQYDTQLPQQPSYYADDSLSVVGRQIMLYLTLISCLKDGELKLEFAQDLLKISVQLVHRIQVLDMVNMAQVLKSSDNDGRQNNVYAKYEKLLGDICSTCCVVLFKKAEQISDVVDWMQVVFDSLVELYAAACILSLNSSEDRLQLIVDYLVQKADISLKDATVIVALKSMTNKSILNSRLLEWMENLQMPNVDQLRTINLLLNAKETSYQLTGTRDVDADLLMLSLPTLFQINELDIVFPEVESILMKIQILTAAADDLLEQQCERILFYSRNLLTSFLDMGRHYMYLNLELFSILMDKAYIFEPYPQQLEIWESLIQGMSNEVVSIFLEMHSYDQLKGIYLSALHNLVAQIVAKLPLTAIKREWPYEQILKLISGSNPFVQKSSYLLLRQLTYEQVEAMSQAVELSSNEQLDEAQKPQLPQELINLVSDIPQSLLDRVDVGSQPLSENPDLFAFLLLWMLLMDNLEHANFKLKAAYAEHLRDSAGLINVLMACCCHVLFIGESSVTRKQLDFHKYQFDELAIEHLDSDSSVTTQVLTASLLSRALKSIPSVVRGWHYDNNDRQLSIAFTEFIRQYVCPLIVEQELSVLSSLGKTNAMENFQVMTQKSSEGSAVNAKYKIDDNNLEMVIEIPPIYPIAQVKLNGVTRVGITEERWRRWLLNVNTVMSSQNGSLLDGLMVFKNEADKHFSGVEDCAICYCVIGSLDRALPTKRCKTCKNKFHPACLSKWFKTSGNSTCPLCRGTF
ncbi:hypothetical protein MIR68_009415 [Amoeboaphelidium protococcarum]|nr:hypothetical protein MIR68_009415 [Amoeboaphelidium protococcarum]